MVDARDLLLQLLIIVAPCMLYQILWRDRRPAGIKPNFWLIGILLSLTAIKCMTIPVHVDEEMLFDLHMIPVVLAFWYIGPRVGFAVTAVVLIYRAYLGGVGFYYQVAVLPLQVLPLLFMHGYIRSFRKVSRTLIAMSAGLWQAVCGMLTYYVYLSVHGVSQWPDSTLHFFFDYMELYVVGTALVSYLIENMMENGHMRREIQRAEKFNVLGQLAASIAHEVRNPITVTRGFMQLLGESDLPDKKQGYIKIAMDELDRAESILSDYLAFAKPQIDKLEVVSLDEQVRNICNVLSSFASLHNVELVPVTGLQLCIEADPAKLRQVLMNIIKNGIEASPHHSTIHIQLSRQKKRALLHIRDEGIGMTDEQLNRLGNPFYSTKENGTGLGLMVSYRLIEAMNGTVEVMSQKGKGTQFTLSFPLADAH